MTNRGLFENHHNQPVNQPLYVLDKGFARCFRERGIVNIKKHNYNTTLATRFSKYPFREHIKKEVKHPPF